jgi:hypothetical protein
MLRSHASKAGAVLARSNHMSSAQGTAEARRKARQDLSRFDALIASPGNLASGFALPGNGRLHVSTSAALGVADALVEVGDRTLSIRSGAANRVCSIGYFEHGKIAIKASGAPGVVSLYVEDGLGVPILIGQG